MPTADDTDARERRHREPSLRVERRMELGKPTITTVRCDDGRETDWTTHRSGEEVPAFPADAGTFAHIDALDVLEHVLDEEVWLAALAALLVPEGTISIRVPLDGPLAWMDALNIYRYVADLSGRGTAPSETLPTGWHRHYRVHDLTRMVRDAGLVVTAVRREGLPGPDLPHLAGLIGGDWVLGRPATEERLIPIRDRLNSWAGRGRAGPLSTHVRIEAMRPSQGTIL
jgi:hypothetical protein